MKVELKREMVKCNGTCVYQPGGADTGHLAYNGYDCGKKKLISRSAVSGASDP